MRFLIAARRGGNDSASSLPTPALWQRPSPLPQRFGDTRPPGAKAPGQRPPRPRRALHARRVGRWPLLFPDLPVCRTPSRAGGETQCVSCSRPEWRKQFHRFNGRGHRPCHSATLRLGQPGPKPPSSARPAPGGRFAPAGSGAGLCRCGPHGSLWLRRARAGKRSAFPDPARRGNSFTRIGKIFRQAGGRIAFPAPCQGRWVHTRLNAARHNGECELELSLTAFPCYGACS
jgi:hypothetical protein